jgi:alkylation response protein AidB-like acyl-CoA dehydrogenase
MIDSLVLEAAQECDEILADFLANKINPGTETRDAGASPITAELLAEAVTLGLFRHALPVELGCTGFDALRWGATLEQVGYRCTDLSFPLLAYVSAAMTMHLVESERTDLIDAYARPAARGELLIGFAYTEDCDPFSFRGRVTRQGDELVIHGRKEIVAGAMIFDAFITYVADSDGSLVAVLVRRDDPGVTVTAVETSGFRAAGFGRLEIDRAVLPASRIVDIDGLAHAQHVLNSQAPFFVAGPLGRMRAVVHDCARRMNRTMRHGGPLADFLNVQSLMGRMYAEVEECRASFYRSLLNLSRGEADSLWNPLAWVVKHAVGNHGIRVITMAQRLAGTAGFLRPTGYDRHLRDLCGLLAGGNPQEKVEVDLGSALLRQMNDTSRGPERGAG